jgi:tRNA (guanine-N7-)-methyltransferase
MPVGVLQTVSIQFPDPFFKKKQHKRRMVQQRLVEELSEKCTSGAKVFVQSDIEEVAIDICEKFAQNGDFRRAHEEMWIAANPFPVKTERETVVEAQGLRVYRALFERR